MVRQMREKAKKPKKSDQEIDWSMSTDNGDEEWIDECPDGKTKPDEQCDDCNDCYNCTIMRGF
jgi:hypothetical protein